MKTQRRWPLDAITTENIWPGDLFTFLRDDVYLVALRAEIGDVVLADGGVLREVLPVIKSSATFLHRVDWVWRFGPGLETRPAEESLAGVLGAAGPDGTYGLLVELGEGRTGIYVRNPAHPGLVVDLDTGATCEKPRAVAWRHWKLVWCDRDEEILLCEF